MSEPTATALYTRPEQLLRDIRGRGWEYLAAAISEGYCPVCEQRRTGLVLGLDLDEDHEPLAAVVECLPCDARWETGALREDDEIDDDDFLTPGEWVDAVRIIVAQENMTCTYTLSRPAA